VLVVVDLPPDVQAQRDIEDRAIKLGNERIAVEGRRERNIQRSLDLMAEAERNGVPTARLAERLQIDRTTLYRWRDAAAIRRDDSRSAVRRGRMRVPSGQIGGAHKP
jgi:transposase-like protein